MLEHIFYVRTYQGVAYDDPADYETVFLGDGLPLWCSRSPSRSFWFVGGGRRLNINDDDDAALIRVHLPMHRYSLGWTISRNEVLRGCDFDIRSNPHRSD